MLPNRFRRLVIGAAAIAALAVPAGSANAALDAWTPWLGLAPQESQSWVRVLEAQAGGVVIYAGTEGDGIFRSVNSGLTWAPFNTGLDADAQDIRVIYFSGTTVFAGTSGGLFSSTAGGAWQPVAQGAEVDPAKPTKLNKEVQAVLSSPTAPGHMLAGVASGGVYTSGDGGSTWQPPAPGNGMAASETVWGLTAHPVTPNLVLAASSSGIYRSTDGGSTWTLSSDGITGSTLRVIVDPVNPLTYYAAGTDGVWRTFDAGVTWQSINGNLGNTTVRGLMFLGSGPNAKLYVATADGLWSTETKSLPVPPPPTPEWRHVTNNGLGAHTILWAVSSFLTPPGTLLVGAQGGGASTLTFTPPINTALPSILLAPTPHVGDTVLAGKGTWSGTQEITFDYQWQRCNSGGSGCADIADATDIGYTIVPADLGKTLRVVVEASNDFPTFGQDKATSPPSAVVLAKQGPLPGDNQLSGPSVSTGLKNVGDTLTAASWLFNPVAGTTYFQWLRCDENGDNCVEIPLATNQVYTLVTADAGLRLRVRVSGSNQFGTTVLPVSNASNNVVPDPAALLPGSAPAIVGSAYVGQSLVGTVGGWKSPKTTWERRWESCEADGSACAPILGQTGASYTPTAADKGRRVRLHVIADVNPSFQLPSPVDAYSPVSDVVTDPPVIAPPAGPGATPDPGANPGPTPVKPKLAKAATLTGKLAVGKLLVAGHGKWTGTPAPKFSYQWLRNGKVIKGATKATYKLKAIDRGKHIRCRITAKNAAGKTAILTRSVLIPKPKRILHR